MNKGLFDQNVDNAWQVPGFQFFMGDLGNSVPYANFLPAQDEFKAHCKFNHSQM